MNSLRFALITAIVLPLIAGCSNNDPYQDPHYKLQRNLRNRNQSWESFQSRQRMRREARDSRHDAWFDNVME